MNNKYLAIGVAPVAAIGAATNNLALGIAVGLVSGLIVARAKRRRD